MAVCRGRSTGFTRDHWTRVEAIWAAEKGLCLLVNGVPLAKNNDSWPVSPNGAVALRVGQGKHDAGEPAPYVLDEIEVLTRLPKEAFQQ